MHVVATRKGEPIFWYALSLLDLAPRHRNVVATAGIRHDDVLDAWAAPDGGLWLELEASTGTDAQHAPPGAFAADGGGTTPAVWRPADLARRSCGRARRVRGRARALRAGRRRAMGGLIPRRRLGLVSPPVRTKTPGWVRATPSSDRARRSTRWERTTTCAPSPVAQHPERPDRARLEAFAVDRVSGDGEVAHPERSLRSEAVARRRRTRCPQVERRDPLPEPRVRRSALLAAACARGRTESSTSVASGRAVGTCSTPRSATSCLPIARARTGTWRSEVSRSTTRGACSAPRGPFGGRSTPGTSARRPTVYAGAGAVCRARHTSRIRRHPLTTPPRDVGGRRRTLSAAARIAQNASSPRPLCDGAPFFVFPSPFFRSPSRGMLEGVSGCEENRCSCRVSLTIQPHLRMPLPRAAPPLGVMERQAERSTRMRPPPSRGAR